MHLSVSNVKTLIHNADMIQRFIRMSGKRPHRLLNTNDFKELLFMVSRTLRDYSIFNELLS